MPELIIKRPLVFFDLETTGVCVNTDRIVELAAIKYKPRDGWWDGTGGSELLLRINPEMPIPKEASDVHGILDPDVSDCPTFDAVSKKIYSFFKGCYLGGYNLKRFDVPLLMRQLAECGHTLKRPPIIDVFSIFKKQMPHTLSGAHRHYMRTDFENAHSALADVKATINVFCRQLLLQDDIKHTPVGIEKQFSSENEIDLAGKLVRDENGGVCLNFGKYKGTCLDKIPSRYFIWADREGIFNFETTAIINKELDR